MANNSHVALFVPLSIMMVLAALNGFIQEASVAGECGKTPIRMAFASLSPCLGAARDARAKVPPACCAEVSMLIQIGPRCLCTVLLSPAAKEARIIPAAAISIPKRCNISSAGSQCGSEYNLSTNNSLLCSHL
ncbi:hypothetical protein ACJRO7_028149 [Eucalyptus globulus]|uniref:Bifunctional inhibitor/plant lipid transfer protein/seed storage helical domain-containing protein n=1 Tax=Eucalyptus globulus TaxID=34317 RepID=A0ABD3JYR2_EUCGL